MTTIAWRRVALFVLACAVPQTATAQSPTAQPDTFDLRIMEELRRLDPVAAATFSAADSARDRGDLETAAQLYSQVRDAHPKYDHAIRRLGWIRLDQGRRDEARSLGREAVRIQRSAVNRLLLASVLADADPNTPGGPAERQEAETFALELVREPGIDPQLLPRLGSIAVALQDWALVRACVQRLQLELPEDMATAFFGWFAAMSEGRHDAALATLERARARGLPDQPYQQMLAMTRKARPLHRRILPTVARVGGIWLAGMLVLLVAGLILSRLTLRTAARIPSVQSGTAVGIDALLRRAYQGVLWLTCGYYYVSVPLVLLAVLGLAGGILYGFFAIGRIPIKLALLVVIIAAVTLWAGLRSFFVARRDEPPGNLLPQEAHPRLQALLRDVAGRIGTRAVDSVYLTPGTDLAVTERGGMLRRLHGTSERCLILGVGVLDGFPLAPFRAVLAHEYGHFSNRDTAGGGFALAVRRSLMNLAIGLAQGGVAAWYNPAWLFFNGFYRIFLRVSQGASRLQEVLADRFAAFAYGSGAFERGLRHVIDRSVRFDALANAKIQEVLQTKQALTNLYAFAPLERPQELEMDRAVDAALHAEPSPYDSHPSPADRIRWVQALGVADSSDSDEEAWTLFESRSAIEQRMTEFVRRRIQGIHGSTLGPDHAVPAQAG